ncbi:MAG: sulfatase [Akkermansiaceae bacterium]
MKFRSLILSFAFIVPALGERANVLLICVDDLRPELKALGAEYIHSPAMDSLVESGRAFTRHYVQAPTCGASRYTLLTGKYAKNRAQRDNGALMSVSGKVDEKPFSMPRYFKENGYKTLAIGKISHYPGGLGGKNWNDPEKPETPGAWDLNVMPTDPWKHAQGAMHGYAGGIARIPGKSPVSEHAEGDDFTYTDGWIAREALKQMDGLAKKEEPFFLAVGLMKPHLPFACPKSYLDIYEGVEIPPVPHPDKPEGLSTWHGSGEFFGNYKHEKGKDPRKDPVYAEQMRRSYAACVSYADAQVAKLLAKLEETGLAENTIVVLWGDHGWHLGEHAVWGKHTLFEESLLAPLVIRFPGMKIPGKRCAEIVETVDIYPTLCELTGVPTPEGLSGESLVRLLDNPEQIGGEAVSYWRNAETIRLESLRLIRHRGKNGLTEFELYEHGSKKGETENIADKHPDLVADLSAMIDEKMK